jgi:hypothetical protein
MLSSGQTRSRSLAACQHKRRTGLLAMEIGVETRLLSDVKLTAEAAAASQSEDSTHTAATL